MASEVTAQRGHTPNTNRVASSTHAFPQNVSVGQLVVVGVAGYSDLDPTDAVTVSDISQSAGTATLTDWQMHATGKLDAGSVEIDAAIFSAIVSGAGSLTAQISKAVDRYWTVGGTVFDGTWDSSRGEAAGNNNGNLNGPNLTTVSGPALSSAGGAVFIGAFGLNTSGGSSSLTTAGGFTEAWAEPNSDLYCVGAMSVRVEASAQSNLVPSWTIGSSLATNGGAAAVHVVLKEVAGGGGGGGGAFFVNQLFRQAIERAKRRRWLPSPGGVLVPAA